MAKRITPATERAARIAAKERSTSPVSPAKAAWRRLRRNKAAMAAGVVIVILLICAVFPAQLAPYGFDEQNYAVAFTAPYKEYPLGTDNLGRDILSRVIWGSRMSLIIGIVSVVVGLLLGGILGAVAAFYGGRVDDVIMRVMDVFLAIPNMLLALGIAASLGTGLWNLLLAIAISNVPRFARIVRSSVMTNKSMEFVEAATAIGASNGRLIFKHLLPNSLAPIIVQGTIGIASGILCACGLSFLGLGIQPPTAEWGMMLSSARQYIRSNWWMVTFPGITIMLAIGCFNLLGDGLRDALDPRMKG